MKKILVALVTLALIISFILSGCSSSTPTPTTTVPSTTKPPTTTAAPTTATPAPSTTAAKSITIKAVTFLPKNLFSVKNIYSFVEQAPLLTNGTVTIQYLGGPEVIPAINQAESVRTGTVQMSIIPIELYDGLVPLTNMTALSLLTPDQEKANGYWDYVNELHKKAGLYCLDRGTATKTPDYFSLITNKPTNSPKDLAGQKIGCSSTLVQPYLKFIGATPVQVANVDAYSALERGVIDGMVDPIQNHNTFQLFTVTKNYIEPGFYRGSVVIIFNLNTWNSLSADQQKALTKIGADSLTKYMDDVAVEIQKAKQNMQSKGMKAVTFNPADSAQFTKDLYEQGWADAAKKYPDVAAKLKPLSGPAK